MMGKLTKRRGVLSALAFLCPVGMVQADVSIATARGSDSEVEVQEQLNRIVTGFDLDEWTFTHTVIIDERSIPHSHPVLTLNARHADVDRLLSTYIHEQLHWYLAASRERTQAAIAELRTVYPEVPVGGSEGARDAESTYLHLVVNYLELQGIRRLLGDARAEDVFEYWAGDHYTWIYATVLKDEARIANIVHAYDLAR